MATNMYKKYTESLTREWPVASGTQAGTLVIHPISNQVGVTLTARGDATRAAGIPGVTGGTIPNGGAGNKSNSATVAVDGSWLLTVTGVTNGDTNPESGSAGTPAGTVVYRTSGGALNLTASGNTAVGVIDDGVIVGGVAPVLIGAVL
ncbi:hypothetical protein SEA_WATERT_25 [Microbacterium phage WaterT]|nr:hypothetical protein SEA_WATERT_25 [Microbacterium phage WaterT]QOC59350.1 hypothetical protein SEA_LIFES_24 [Microbacterium phage Lifes]USH44481.1 hypothetical protein SEA_CASSITA_26 [Microbacterium phage Cassita]